MQRPFQEGFLAKTVNVSETAFRAMQTGYCTYMDLYTKIGLEGALNLIEIWQVAEYNRNKIEYFSRQE